MILSPKAIWRHFPCYCLISITLCVLDVTKTAFYVNSQRQPLSGNSDFNKTSARNNSFDSTGSLQFSQHRHDETKAHFNIFAFDFFVCLFFFLSRSLTINGQRFEVSKGKSSEIWKTTVQEWLFSECR